MSEQAQQAQQQEQQQAAPEINLVGGADTGATSNGVTVGNNRNQQAQEQPAGNRPWYAGIPENLLDDHIKSFKTLEDVVKSYQHARGLVGKKALKLGDVEQLTDEQRKMLFKQLGVPESPDEYEIPVDAPELAEDVKLFKNIAHEIGMTKAQASDLWNKYVQLANERAQAQQQEAFAALKQEWGAEFDKRLATVQQVVQQLGVSDLLVRSGLATSPEVAIILDKVAQRLSGDNTQVPPQTPVVSVEAIRQQITELRKSPEFLRGDSAAVQRLTDLYAQLSQLEQRDKSLLPAG